MTRVTRQSLFNRLDRNGDGAVNRGELKKLGQEADVDSGLLGGLKLKGAVDATLDRFDADRDDTISRAEFMAQAHTLIPAGLEIDPARARAEPGYVRAQVAAYVARVSGQGPDGAIDRAALEAQIQAELDRAGTPMSGLMAEVAAKIALKTLDGNGDGGLDADELTSFAADAVKDLDD
jgi:Ca2+-binding EF-hand superfamily protein